jgi:hypothetical protein
MSKVSVREAAFLTGKSRETINTATKDGILSFTLNERNHKAIDIAELERVYPLVKSPADMAQSGNVSDGQELTESGPSDLREQVAVLREKLESSLKENGQLTSERERERRQLEEQIEQLRTSLEKAQDQHGKAMLLLTHQSSEEGAGGQQSIQIKALEETMLKIRKQNRRIYQELQAEKSKPLWKKLFG